MISLVCTNCRATIEMDDGFAGGVCRCKHCGTIQTVPSRLRPKTPEIKPNKTLYKKPARTQATTGSGLDELAQVVASSSGLSSPRLRAKTIEPKKSPRTKWLILIGALIVVCITVAWFFLRDQDKPQAVNSETKVQIESPALSPEFCGVPIAGNSIIYVLDRGSGTAEFFSYLKEAAFKSLQNLGRDRKFQIIFWNNGSDDAYPDEGTVFATPQNIEAARHLLDGVTAHGQSEVRSALTKAIAASPDLIILATGKGEQLDDDFVKTVMQIRQNNSIRIDTFDIGGNQSSPPMQHIAQNTGGVSKLVGASLLKTAAAE